MTDVSGIELVKDLAQALDDKKGANIMALDVRGISSMTDYFLIAEGNVERHVKALAGAVQERMKEHGDQPAYVEGLEIGDWVVIDCWSVVVHLFVPQLRQKYQLERLWTEAKLIDLDLDTSVAGVREVDVV
jgi:ribosome-associated protein